MANMWKLTEEQIAENRKKSKNEQSNVFLASAEFDDEIPNELSAHLYWVEDKIRILHAMIVEQQKVLNRINTMFKRF